MIKYDDRRVTIRAVSKHVEKASHPDKPPNCILQWLLLLVNDLGIIAKPQPKCYPMGLDDHLWSPCLQTILSIWHPILKLIIRLHLVNDSIVMPVILSDCIKWYAYVYICEESCCHTFCLCWDRQTMWLLYYVSEGGNGVTFMIFSHPCDDPNILKPWALIQFYYQWHILFSLLSFLAMWERHGVVVKGLGFPL